MAIPLCELVKFCLLMSHLVFMSMHSLSSIIQPSATHPNYMEPMDATPPNFLSIQISCELPKTSIIPLPTSREDSHRFLTCPLLHGQGAAPLSLVYCGQTNQQITAVLNSHYSSATELMSPPSFTQLPIVTKYSQVSHLSHLCSPC